MVASLQGEWQGWSVVYMHVSIHVHVISIRAAQSVYRVFSALNTMYLHDIITYALASCAFYMVHVCIHPCIIYYNIIGSSVSVWSSLLHVFTISTSQSKEY